MQLSDAIQLIENAVPKVHAAWADIGAGSGLFTQALQHILPSGKVFAMDKNPNGLYKLSPNQTVELEIIAADFNNPLPLPNLDGMLMANALHYAANPIVVLNNILASLKPKGILLLIEYDTATPNPPWVPYPIPFPEFQQLAHSCGLSEPIKVGQKASIYGHNQIYAASCVKG